MYQSSEAHPVPNPISKINVLQEELNFDIV